MNDPAARRSRFAEWPVLLALVANVALIAWTWPQLPERVPDHFTIQGQVDGYGDRFEALIMLPLIFLFPLLMTYAVQVGAGGSVRVFRAVRLGLALLGLGLTTQQAFGWDIARVLSAALGLFLLGLGNVMGTVQPSVWIGFQTPWTHRSRRAWIAGQRRSGSFFFSLGLLFVVAGLTLPDWLLFPWVMPYGFPLVVLGGTAWLFSLSYLDYKADPNPEPIQP